MSQFDHESMLINVIPSDDSNAWLNIFHVIRLHQTSCETLPIKDLESMTAKSRFEAVVLARSLSSVMSHLDAPPQIEVPISHCGTCCVDLKVLIGSPYSHIPIIYPRHDVAANYDDGPN